MIRIVRSRPVASLAISTFAGCSSYAVCTEYQSKTLVKDTEYLPREYSRDKIVRFWKQRPISVISRLTNIVHELLPVVGSYIYDFKLCGRSSEELQQQHAVRLKNTLTRLGPAFIKFGQQLSIRPDIVPATVLKELQKLCDAVDSFEDEIAFDTIKEDLGERAFNQLEGLVLVASASLGQVYKAKKKGSNEIVAVKVQRPDMLNVVSLDLFLLHCYGQFLDDLFHFTTEQIPFHADFIDCFAKGSYEELDYEKEAGNQLFFKEEFRKRKCNVFIPDVHRELTSRRVLTSQWINGTQLAKADPKEIQRLIPVGVELFLTQLLDIGKFHSDPHPGNLYVSNEGQLCLIDFGLCAEVDSKSRRSMTSAIVHLLTGDFDSLINVDAKDLGFLPIDMDVSELKPILTKILDEGLLQSGSNLHARKRKLISISNELNEVFFRYPFSVPPFFALITRGLGLLEGIALTGDPNFDIFQASLPYASRRAAEIYGKHQLHRLRRNNDGSDR